ncbi:tyrosine-type recombinase/integrase [Jeotgalibacillus marinus]|uniref:Site-specific integrase n=1 Tax=Jeotgalibacillus marinus TaxID=86667 RepID=A0ABV3Q075_9BACL
MRGGVRKRGSTWYYYFEIAKIDGKRQKIERTAEGAATKSEAERVLRRKIMEYENIGSITKPSEMSVHDFLMFWQKEYVQLKLKPNTQYNYESIIRIHILPHLGKYKLKSLSPHVMQQFVNLKVREGWARKTIEIMIGVLNKSLKQAVYPYKYINENPMQYVELLIETSRKPTREDLKIQSRENFKILSENVREGHPFYLPYMIGLNAALRVGETCGLEWKHIDFEDGVINVEQQLVGKKTEIEGKTKLQWEIGPPKSKAG